MSSTTSKSGKTLGTAKRSLPKLKDEDRCTSIDQEHNWLRCMKKHDHALNWHEADDGEGWHSWVDPTRRPRATPSGRTVITVDLPVPEPTRV